MRNLTLKILVALVALMGAESAVGQPMDIKEFVHKVYIHGVPYERLKVSLRRLGLALSDHPKATAALKSVWESVKSSDDGAEKDMISEALRINREITGGGLGEYYRSSRP